MRWLWKDWPAPVKAGLGSPQLQRNPHSRARTGPWLPTAIASPRARPERCRATCFSTTSRPERVTRSAPDGKASPFLADTKRANGQAFGPDGRLFAVATGRRPGAGVRRRRQGHVFAEGIRGNDLVIRHDGGVFVTQREGGGAQHGMVYQPSRAKNGSRRHGLGFANGITLSPDQNTAIRRRFWQPLDL